MSLPGSNFLFLSVLVGSLFHEWKALPAPWSTSLSCSSQAPCPLPSFLPLWRRSLWGLSHAVCIRPSLLMHKIGHRCAAIASSLFPQQSTCVQDQKGEYTTIRGNEITAFMSEVAFSPLAGTEFGLTNPYKRNALFHLFLSLINKTSLSFQCFVVCKIRKPSIHNPHSNFFLWRCRVLLSRYISASWHRANSRESNGFRK